MWPRLQEKQTATTQSNQYISLIPSFRHENMKLGVTYDTGHSSPECGALIRWMRRRQQGADIFLISATIFHPNPSSFSQWILFSPYILLNLPPFQFNPNSPSFPYITQSLLWYALLREKGWWVGFFPGPDVFLRVNTSWSFCDLIGWLVPSLQHTS